MKEKLNNLLKQELLCSMGCTEPSAIAFAASFAKEMFQFDEDITKVELKASSNILKNALCVMIPNTKISGIEMIMLLGIVSCDSENKLTILNNMSKEDIKDALTLRKKIDMSVSLVKDVNPLYIEVQLCSRNHHVKVIVEKLHNQIKCCYVDGELVFNNELLDEQENERLQFSFEDIYSFVNNNEFDRGLIYEVRKYNTEIGEYGLDNDVGLNVGSTINDSNLYTPEYKDIIATTVSGIDSRMSGVPKKVIINSGSGNQGITATVPIVTYARSHNISEEEELKALTLSHLVTLYIRSKQNRLSSSCGAVCASAGVAAGLSYMMGCNKKQIEGAITNLLCSNFGVFCDGAKTTCSLKVASGISSAINASLLAKNNVFVSSSLGVISPDLDKTLEALSAIEEQFTKNLDEVIMSQAIKNTGTLKLEKKM